MFLKKFLPLLFTFTVACSGVNIKKDFSDNDALTELKNSGVIVRIWKNNPIKPKEVETDLAYWLAGYRRYNSLTSLPLSELNAYSSTETRFYQSDAERSFLQEKSLGVIKFYLSQNRQTLIRLMADYKLDSLIFYEVDGYFSGEFMYIAFESLIAVINKDGELLYMDHASVGESTDDWDIDVVRRTLLNRMSGRFLLTMENLGFAEKQ